MNVEIKPGYKMTEVGAIPEDWCIRLLGELVIFLDGKRKPVKDADRAKMKGNIPYYGASGVIDYVNDYLFNEDLVLLGEDGENILSRNCRLAFKISGKAWVNNHAHVLKPYPDINIDFLADYLESLNYESYNSGTAQPKLNKQACLAIPIALPSIFYEQQLIAVALSDTGALIESLEQLIVKKRRIKQGAMQVLLKPKSKWHQCKVSDLMTIMHGKCQHDIADSNGIYPILATSGQIGTTNHYLYDKPSVLIGRKGTIDRPQYMTKPFWSVDTLFYTVICEPYIPKYCFYQFCLIDWKKYNEASGVPSLSARTIGQIELKVPSVTEQENICNILSDIDTELDALETKLSKLKKIKKGMMQNLLTGKIRLV